MLYECTECNYTTTESHAIHRHVDEHITGQPSPISPLAFIRRRVECHCGRRLALSNYGQDTICESCGQRWNAFGQALRANTSHF